MGIKFPTPWKTLIIKFPPPRDGKGVKYPGYARGGMLKLRFDRYIIPVYVGYLHRSLLLAPSCTLVVDLWQVYSLSYISIYLTQRIVQENS